MTVTINRRGTPPQERQFHAECILCKTDFSFHAADAERVLDMREGDFFRIGCPVCGHSVTKAA